jgi:ABC-type microcin C transport system duplicated ATPase subunit YejF
VQAEIVSLLRQLQESTALTMLFITHDLALARDLCRDTVVLRAGRIVERGETSAVFARPAHPYTQELVAAATFHLPLTDRRQRGFRPGRAGRGAPGWSPPG